MRVWLLGLIIVGQAATADPVRQVEQTAQRLFDRLPQVRLVDQIAGHCGADETVNDKAAFCTTTNQILLARAAAETPQAPYLVAHLYGHAVQVQHGIADFALSQIRQRRAEEAMLRGLVERQVDCIAGFIMARAGLPETDLTSLFSEEPFTDSHWGRDPLHIGPQVAIGLAESAAWFARGQAGDLSACAPGEFTATLLLDALNR